MKKHLIFLGAFIMILSSTLFGQVSTTPEVPRNYKPAPKELLPMPDSLTNEQIFPVLGTYTLMSKDEQTYPVTVSLDSANNGTVWVEGLPQGKFKAVLRGSPATYKIPTQGKITGGTLILNDVDGTLYVNMGNKFNEDKPTAAFVTFTTAEDVAAADTATVEVVDKPIKKKVKSSAQKGIVYTGKKDMMQ